MHLYTGVGMIKSLLMHAKILNMKYGVIGFSSDLIETIINQYINLAKFLNQAHASCTPAAGRHVPGFLELLCPGMSVWVFVCVCPPRGC